MENQTNIFEMLYPTFKIDKPIRLITLFSGYDSQALALKYLGVKFEHYKTCEWAVKSIQALKDLHFENDNTDYSKNLTDDEVKEYLLEKGISSNYNDPMSKEQIKRLKNHRQIYNNIQATHNLVNIQQVKGKDLCIKDTDKFTYLLTYSFPCQDLSLAGNRKGMSDTSTRSGMLWEVERILGELEERPQILLMENVPMIHSQENTNDFNKWQLRLEQLGYKNYWQDLIATDYGIPQTRNRTFMVSILGDYNYTFPKPIPLKLKLKDLLEDNVDKKYYIDNKELEFIKNNIKLDYVNYIEYERYNNHFEQNCRVWKDKVPSLHTMNQQIKIFVKNNNKKGYLEATEGDCIDLCQPNSKTRRGRVQKEKSQTISTMGGEHLGVVVKKMGDYSTSNYVVKGIATNESKEWQKEPLEEKSRTLLANKSNAGVGCIDTNLRIRKLTPKECFRLMGVKDEDFGKVKKNQSDSSLYHLAGDSIVVNVLMAIFGEMIQKKTRF